MNAVITLNIGLLQTRLIVLTHHVLVYGWTGYTLVVYWVYFEFKHSTGILSAHMHSHRNNRKDFSGFQSVLYFICL